MYRATGSMDGARHHPKVARAASRLTLRGGVRGEVSGGGFRFLRARQELSRRDDFSGVELITRSPATNDVRDLQDGTAVD
jgi:hypothetical protein